LRNVCGGVATSRARERVLLLSCFSSCSQRS
jgi:hypothetical protein